MEQHECRRWGRSRAEQCDDSQLEGYRSRRSAKRPDQGGLRVRGAVYGGDDRGLCDVDRVRRRTDVPLRKRVRRRILSARRRWLVWIHNNTDRLHCAVWLPRTPHAKRSRLGVWHRQRNSHSHHPNLLLSRSYPLQCPLGSCSICRLVNPCCERPRKSHSGCDWVDQPVFVIHRRPNACCQRRDQLGSSLSFLSLFLGWRLATPCRIIWALSS